MEIDKDRIDDAILALLYLTLDWNGRARYSPVADHVAGIFAACDNDTRHERASKSRPWRDVAGLRQTV